MLRALELKLRDFFKLPVRCKEGGVEVSVEVEGVDPKDALWMEHFILRIKDFLPGWGKRVFLPRILVAGGLDKKPVPLYSKATTDKET